MEYHEAKCIFREIQVLFESRLVLIKGDFFQHSDLPKVNFRNELKTISEVQFTVEQHTQALLKLYLKNPLVQNLFIELYQLNDYCLKFTYEVHQSASQHVVDKLRWNRYKIHYLLELYASFTKYAAFLNLYLLPLRMGNVPGANFDQNPLQVLQISNQRNPGAPEPEDEELEDEVLAKQIAILSELDVIDHPKMENLKDEDKRNVFRYLIGGSDRYVKGNISILQPNSKENPLNYTSYQHVEWAKKVLRGTIKLVKPKESA